MRGRDWATAVACVVFIIFQVYLDLKIPEYMSAITDAIASDKPPSAIYGYGCEMVVCALLSFGASLAASGFAVLTATSLCRTLRKMIFDNVCKFSPEDVDRFSIDSLITRCSNDVPRVQEFIAQAMQVVVKTPILSVWAIMKISGAEWQWVATTAAGIAVLSIVISVVILSNRPRFKRIPVITDRINLHALEHLSGLRVARAYNAERFQERRFADASFEVMDNSIEIWKRTPLMPAMSSGTSNFLTLMIYLTGISLIAGSTGSPHNLVLFSNMIVFSSYSILIISSFMQLSFMIQTSTAALASSKRVREIVSHEPAIGDGAYEGGGEGGWAVEFDRVDFAYPGTSSKVLHDVSFRVPRGGTFAILGATGSGKSTVANLILRLYTASSGTVRVDSVDVRDYRHDVLCGKLGYVPQTDTIFTGTVYDNVNYGATAPERTEDDVRNAIEIAQAKEFVDELPGKEAFRVSERGSNLSGGQRQRLSIARAVCKDADILILDDPFSALDFSTDKKLRESLRKNCAGTTKILITQRVGTVADADQIMVLDEGRIVGMGKHAELLEGCPLYREIAESQAVEGAS